MAKVFLHDRRHGHAQRCSEILNRHLALPFVICEQFDQASRQVLRVAWAIKIQRDFLSGCHLPEIGNVRGDDRHSVGAGQMCYTAASCGRRIRHNRDGRCLKEIRQLVFVNVAGELDGGARIFFSHRLHVTVSLGMVSPRDH